MSEPVTLNPLDLSLAGIEAVYVLIQEAYPLLELTPENSRVYSLQASPTPEEPGRAFLGIKRTTGEIHAFRYQRVSLSKHFGERVYIEIPDGVMSPLAMVEELNVEYDTQISMRDALYDATPIDPVPSICNFVLKARRESLVWFGKTVITARQGGDIIEENTVVDDDGEAIVDDDGEMIIWDEDEDFSWD